MGLKKSDLFSSEPTNEAPLGPWHANLIYIARRKCILFVNDITLFNFIVSDVKRDQIKKLADMFKTTLSCVLSEEGISGPRLEHILSGCEDAKISKTDSKKVLGTMNDLAYHYELSILDAGGVHSYQIPEIIKKLNRMPMGALEYGSPVEALKKIDATT